MKRVAYIFMAAVMLIAILPTQAYAVPPVRLIIDNHEIRGLDTPPRILQNRIMVPARAVFEQVGGTVEWNEPSRLITVRFGGDTLHMTVGQTQAQLNGRAITMEVAPVILGGRTLIPLRFPAEAFGFDVAWDHVGRAAVLHSPFDEQEQTTHEVDLVDPQSPQDNPNLATDVSSTHIESIPHPGTNIIDIRSPQDSGADAFAIIASSAITDVNHFLLPDNRLVVDIYNAVSNLTGPFEASGAVRGIRTSQFSNTPDITRVVFELAGVEGYSVSLSHDRRTITVAFSVNTISHVTATAGATSDTVVIHGDFQPSVRLSSAGYPNYMMVYIDNARMEATGAEISEGSFASGFSTGRNADGVSFVRINMRSGRWPSVSLNHGSNQVSISMHEGLNGIRYDFATRELRIPKTMAIDLSRVQLDEDYLINRYIFTFPVSGLGSGSIHIGDGYVNSVTMRQNAMGYTQVVFDTARVMAFTVHVTSTELVIRGNLPREVYDFIVIIDPGHGGRDPGAVHHGIRESDVVLAISHLVMGHLERNPNIRAYMTRSSDVTVANAWRAAFANEKMADLYVSIHANAVNNRPTVTGVETWYMNHSREATRGITSREFARIMQYNLIMATGAIDRGIKPNSNWIVLRDTNMPAVLMEVGFLSNREEAMRLNNPQHQQVIARAIYDGIVEAYRSATSR
ncbi:MAG: N-acetylmuramoyl-L-alanine amidase family protein [Defluviitaleaceae bacterium]|nr:N-acetylmuramoyl-L-alanine amidase family protein [Defluviitaleaceae bacterium]